MALSSDRMRDVDTGSNAIPNTDGLDVADVEIHLPGPSKDTQTVKSRTALRSKIEQFAMEAKIEDDSVFDDISHISERYSKPMEVTLPMHLQNMEFLPVQQVVRDGDDDEEVKEDIWQRRERLEKQREEAQAAK